MARRHAQGIVLLTKAGVNWTDRFQEAVEVVEALSCGLCLIDGEIGVCGNKGVPSFELLRKRWRLTTVIADLIELDGVDLRPKPIEHRRELLQSLIDVPALVFSPYLPRHCHFFRTGLCL